jgi:hypothetical protein
MSEEPLHGSAPRVFDVVHLSVQFPEIDNDPVAASETARAVRTAQQFSDDVTRRE